MTKMNLKPQAAFLLVGNGLNRPGVYVDNDAFNSANGIGCLFVLIGSETTSRVKYTTAALEQFVRYLSETTYGPYDPEKTAIIDVCLRADDFRRAFGLMRVQQRDWPSFAFEGKPTTPLHPATTFVFSEKPKNGS